MSNPTICINCKMLEREQGTKSNIWYYLRCRANPLPVKTDFTTGERITELKFCRDVNTGGRCPVYVEKSK